MSVWSKTITLAFLLLFSVQSFSYPVLLLRYYHHYDCSSAGETCHKKEATRHCTGTCNLTKQIKDAGTEQEVPGSQKNELHPEIPEPALLLQLLLPENQRPPLLPDPRSASLIAGIYNPVFQPPLQ